MSTVHEGKFVQNATRDDSKISGSQYRSISGQTHLSDEEDLQVDNNIHGVRDW